MPTEAFRRLRLLGLLGIAAIAGVAAIQIAVMSVLIVTTHPIPGRLPTALSRERANLRWAGLDFAVATFAVAGLMYFIVVRPVERSWQRMVEHSERSRATVERALRRERAQRNRLTAVAEIKSRRAAHSEDQIVEILAMAANALGLEEGAVSFVEGDTLRIGFSVTDRVPVGLQIPLAQTFARHVYGSHQVVAIADTETLEWRDDEAVSHQQWQSYIGTTIYVESEPVAMLSFTARAPRDEPFDDSDEGFMRVVAALIASTLDRMRTERELEKRAHYDTTTALPNRMYFVEQAERMLARAQRRNEVMNLLFIDLDGFKSINDGLGHATGDEVLRIVAARLRALVRGEDVLARLGGDEFVIAQSSDNSEAALFLGRRIVEAIGHSFLVSGIFAKVGASVGTASYPRDASDLQALLERADSAMYEAKNRGKGAAVAYGAA